LCKSTILSLKLNAERLTLTMFNDLNNGWNLRKMALNIGGEPLAIGDDRSAL